MMKNKKQLSSKQAFNHIAELCSRSEYCIFDVRRKLYSFDLAESEREKIIQKLVNEKFIDEVRYCKAYVNDKIHFNRWGVKKIRAELAKRRIPDELIDETINDFRKIDMLKILVELLLKKRESIKYTDETELNTKLVTFAYSRGFLRGETEKALEVINNNRL
jgi:regulatory protein